jgi:hypothetical protein
MREDRKIHFATSAYGDAFAGLLLTNIYSIQKSHPAASVTVYWQDINKARIMEMQNAFPNIKFVNTSYYIPDDYKKRVAAKTLLCEQAIKESPQEHLCFLDCDMLVLRSIEKYFSNDFDIAFTVKPERAPINTGLVLVKCSKVTEHFFKQWRIKALEIVDTPHLSALTSSRDHPYGGPGQMALHLLIKFDLQTTCYSVECGQHIVKLISYPCAELNETNSVPITKEHHALHYKAGWQPILVHGNDFTTYRTKDESWEMYVFYLKTFREAITHLKKTNTKTSYKDFPIKIPFYIDKNYKEVAWKYRLFSLLQKIRRSHHESKRVIKAVINRIPVP